MKLWEIKLEILFYGIEITDNAYNNLKHGIDGKVNVDDYITTKGLMLALNDEVYVSGIIKNDSKYIVDYFDGKYVLKRDAEILTNVTIIQPPDYALNNYLLKSGEPITSLINVHGDRARLQPIRGCANRCMFCDINKYKYLCNSIEVLDEAFTYVKDNIPFEHVLISGGTPVPRNDAYDYLNNVYKYFGENYGSIYPIDVMMVPRGLTIEKNNKDGYIEFLNKLKSWNITGVYANLEMFNDDLRKKFIPQKDLVGKEGYYTFLNEAVKIFGPKNVKSCIIVGLESVEDTLSGVEFICSTGAIPVLSPYIPIDDKIQPPSVEVMREVLLGSQKIVEKYNTELGPLCKSCKHNTIHFG